MFSKTMNRKAVFEKLQAIKQSGEATLAAIRAKGEAKRAAFLAWDEPRRSYEASIRELESATALHELNVGRAEQELARDAEAHIRPMRDFLCAEFQRMRCGVDKENVGVITTHLNAIRDAIAALDELAVSGEADVPSAAKRIMATVPGKWNLGNGDRMETNTEMRVLPRA